MVFLNPYLEFVPYKREYGHLLGYDQIETTIAHSATCFSSAYIESRRAITKSVCQSIETVLVAIMVRFRRASERHRRIRRVADSVQHAFRSICNLRVGAFGEQAEQTDLPHCVVC